MILSSVTRIIDWLLQLTMLPGLDSRKYKGEAWQKI